MTDPIIHPEQGESQQTHPLDLLLLDLPDHDFLIGNERVSELSPEAGRILRALIRGGGVATVDAITGDSLSRDDLAEPLWLLRYDLTEITDCNDPIIVDYDEDTAYRINPALRISRTVLSDVQELASMNLLADEVVLSLCGLLEASNKVRQAQSNSDQAKLNDRRKARPGRLDQYSAGSTDQRVSGVFGREALELKWDEKSPFTPEELKLIGEGIPLIGFVTYELSGRLPKHVEQEELAQAAFFGLVDAAQRFDPNLGNEFSTYAVHRIRGSVIDYLRELDWAPRLVRARAKRLGIAKEQLVSELGRNPSQSEIAKKTGISQDALVKLETEIHNAGIVSIHLQVSNEADLDMNDCLADPAAFIPFEQIENSDAGNYLRNCLDKLVPREKRVLQEYYYSGLTFKEIGQRLGVTESRICQMHTSAIEKLRLIIASDNRKFKSEVVA